MRSLCAAAALLAALARADWSQGEVGVDHMYFDIDNFAMTTNGTSECYQACLSTPSCKGWVVCPANVTGCENSCSKPGVSTCWRKSDMGNTTLNQCRISGYSPRALLPQAFTTMPLGTVTPTGWLANELNVQAAGLTGYLSKFWGDIQNSTWIGGPGDGGLHERTPYWLNGLVPLSYLVQNADIAAQRDSYLQYIMDHQAPSGWLGPDDMPTDGDQYWGRINIVLSLIQYYEGSADPRAITVLFNYLGEAQRRLNAQPVTGWASVRSQDWIMGLWWLADNFDTLKGVPAGYTQAFLLDLANTIHAQMLGTAGNADWKSWFDTDQFPTTAACDGPGTPCNMLTHGVNIGQAIKSEAVWYRRSHDLTDVASTYIRINKLDAYHGVPSGMYQADEHLAGNLPSHGTETCAVVEAVVSYAVSGAIIGDPYLFERAERVAYNALPAAMTKDMWERVYLQQSNEITATHEDPHIFYTDGDDSATFSLEGNYGCCTANMHAGWPKFTQRAVGYNASTGAVAVLMWAPLTATTPYGTVAVTTDYPFGDTATVTVTPASGATGPVPVLLRIPSWAAGATLSVNGGPASNLLGSNGTFYPTSTVGTAATTFTLSFNPTIKLETWYNGAVAVTRGPLVYTMWIGQNISVTGQYAFNSQDLAITRTSDWNMALVIKDRSNPGADLTFNRLAPPSAVPFNSTAIPVTITGMGQVVNSWGIVQNAADGPPASPACAAAGACGAPVPITLVPFGSTHVRMTVLPTA